MERWDVEKAVRRDVTKREMTGSGPARVLHVTTPRADPKPWVSASWGRTLTSCRSTIFVFFSLLPECFFAVVRRTCFPRCGSAEDECTRDAAADLSRGGAVKELSSRHENTHRATRPCGVKAFSRREREGKERLLSRLTARKQLSFEQADFEWQNYITPYVRPT